MKIIDNNIDVISIHNSISSYNEPRTIFYNSISKIINNLINYDFLISDENNVCIYIDKIIVCHYIKTIMSLAPFSISDWNLDWHFIFISLIQLLFVTNNWLVIMIT